MSKERQPTPEHIKEKYKTLPPEVIKSKEDKEKRQRNKRAAKKRYYDKLKKQAEEQGPSTRTRSKIFPISSRTRSQTVESARLRQKRHRASIDTDKKEKIKK
ncbi:3797_t:CDS:1, partial [Dentiscutata erythropus]